MRAVRRTLINDMNTLRTRVRPYYPVIGFVAFVTLLILLTVKTNIERGYPALTEMWLCNQAGELIPGLETSKKLNHSICGMTTRDLFHHQLILVNDEPPNRHLIWKITWDEAKTSDERAYFRFDELEFGARPFSPGRYRFQLYWGKDVLSEMKISVIK